MINKTLNIIIRNYCLSNRNILVSRASNLDALSDIQSTKAGYTRAIFPWQMSLTIFICSFKVLFMVITLFKRCISECFHFFFFVKLNKLIKTLNWPWKQKHLASQSPWNHLSPLVSFRSLPLPSIVALWYQPGGFCSGKWLGNTHKPNTHQVSAYDLDSWTN